MDPVAIEYALTGAGFCDVQFRVGDAHFAVEQLGDSPCPLEELMLAALALARDEQPPRVFWDPEDGGLYLWYFSRENDVLHLRVAYVDSQDSEERGPIPEIPATPLEATCLVRTFCSSVAECATQVIAHYGPDRYAELWLAPFPFDLLDALQRSIGP